MMLSRVACWQPHGMNSPTVSRLTVGMRKASDGFGTSPRSATKSLDCAVRLSRAQTICSKRGGQEHLKKRLRVNHATPTVTSNAWGRAGKRLSSTSSRKSTESQARSVSRPAPSRRSGGSRRRKSTMEHIAGANSNATVKASFRRKTLRQRLNAVFLTPRVIPFPRWITPRHFTITISEICGHLSFTLIFLSYAVDDFLLLRVIAVAGSTSILFFSYFHPYGRPLWLPMKWNALFILVNSYRIGKALFEKYQARNLSAEMLEIHNNHFTVIDLVDFAKLVKAGELEEFEPGEVVLRQGEWNPYLRLVLDGELDVSRDGHVTYTLEEGNFISELGLHAGLKLTGPVESSATVLAKEDSSPIRCLRWDRTKLIAMLENEKTLSRSFQSALSWDVVSKLKGQRAILSRHNTTANEVIEYRRNQSDFRYLAILHNVLGVMGNGDHAEEKVNKYREEINMYRMIHHVSEEQHRSALAQCGWTPEEFEAGRRNSSRGFMTAGKNVGDSGEHSERRGLGLRNIFRKRISRVPDQAWEL